MLSVHSCPAGNIGARDTGGMSVYIRELATEMDRQGHAVDVFTRVHDPADPRIIELGQDARLIHLPAGSCEGINKLDIYPHLPAFSGELESFRRQNGRRYDLIFSHYWLSGWVGERLRRAWQIPHITMFHTLAAVKNNLPSGEREPALRLRTERELATGCDLIIAPTERERDNIISYYSAIAENIGIVPCGINLERFQPEDGAQARRALGLGDETIILFVGRIDPLKGIDNLLQAMPLLRNSGKYRLALVGGDKNDPQEREGLQTMIQNLGIADMVTCPGLIKHGQLARFYNAADVCVVPSYYESFGLVALESLACGTPVVATDVGDLGNIIRQGETGYIIRDNSPDNIAEGILKAASLTKIPDKTFIRDSVSGFSWANITRQISAECRAVLDKSLAGAA